MSELESRIKEIAKKEGVALVGIASKERLLDAPASGNPEYLLPSTLSVISLAMSVDKDIVKDFLGKKDWLSHGDDRKEMARALFTISDKLTLFLRDNGFEAVTVGVNNNYRPEGGTTDVSEMTEFIPDFAHRYGAVAAGIGRLGWSGNVLHPEYGSLLELGSILTSAELEPDPLMEENPCDQCKMCSFVCPVEMISKKESKHVRVAGIDEEIALKKPNTCCWIGCTGYQGLSVDGKWSNWSPYRLGSDLPDEKKEWDILNNNLLKVDPLMTYQENGDLRKATFDPDWRFATVCGNCRGVCWPDRMVRMENMRLLTGSGVVVLSPDGQHIIANDEIIELETPFLVKVAMLKKDYQSAINGSLEIGEAVTPMDKAVLTHLFR